MDWWERVYGYTGAAGMVQGFAAGYFLWDLCVSAIHVSIFGWGMLAHAIAALIVFSLGFVSLQLYVYLAQCFDLLALARIRAHLPIPKPIPHSVISAMSLDCEYC